MTLSADERLSLQKLDFIEKVKLGVPPLHAAIDLGWSARRLSRLMAEKDFAEMLATAIDYRDDAVEMVAFQKAVNGNMEAIKLWLQNRRPDRWADKRVHEIHATGGMQIAVIDATKDALAGFLAEAGSRSEAIAALRPGGALDDIVDAEILDDDE